MSIAPARSLVRCAGSIAIALCSCAAMAQPPRIAVDAPIPFGRQAVDYDGPTASNRVAQLIHDLHTGKQSLSHDPRFGYLPALLRALEVPVESQVLVFSKTSLNHRLITPATPRALYFNDDTYVGWVPEIAALEITAVDDDKGALFYVLPQSADGPPVFSREGRCLACHASSNTLRVPGHLVRSFATDETGKMLWGFSQVTHDTPLAQRWGGWYVTGRHGKQPHLGNLFGEETHRRHRQDPQSGGNVTNLRPFFDVDQYLSPHSDLVALLVLDHQTHMQNVLTRLSFDHRLAQDSDITEAALRYLLWIDAPPLTEPVQGTSGFAQWFAQKGPRDKQGRSLRELNLKTRLFEYRCSYLIYSSQFAALPPAVKERLLRRVWEVLTGQDTSEDFARLPPSERRAILEILTQTLPGLPHWWRLPAGGK